MADPPRVSSALPAPAASPPTSIGCLTEYLHRRFLLRSEASSSSRYRRQNGLRMTLRDASRQRPPGVSIKRRANLASALATNPQCVRRREHLGGKSPRSETRGADVTRPVLICRRFWSSFVSPMWLGAPRMALLCSRGAEALLREGGLDQFGSVLDVGAGPGD